MTTVVLNRRNLLAAGGTVLATGVSGLLLPARAQGIAPTPSMSGGSNNYRKGAATVDQIGKGGFWTSWHSYAAQATGLRSPGSASRFGRTRPKDRSMSRKAMEPRSPTGTGRSVLRCRRLFPSLANRMVTSPMTAVNSKPSFYVP